MRNCGEDPSESEIRHRNRDGFYGAGHEIGCAGRDRGSLQLNPGESNGRGGGIAIEISWGRRTGPRLDSQSCAGKMSGLG